MAPPTPAPPEDPGLRATEFLDFPAPEIGRFMAGLPDAGQATDRERAVWLYYAVRDGIRYEVYGADLSRAGLRASRVAATGTGMCLHKSVLFAACLRAAGIASRLVLTDVRNHLASPRLTEYLGSDVFHQHCLTSVRLDGRWLRATPVFNRTLCRLYRMDPLEFDGRADSVHHPYDRTGRRHMEFLREHGEFDDLPYDFVIGELRAAHAGMFGTPTRVRPGSLESEAAR
jgi:transglutaminase-like putative cysteine protease